MRKINPLHMHNMRHNPVIIDTSDKSEYTSISSFPETRSFFKVFQGKPVPQPHILTNLYFLFFFVAPTA